MTDVFDKDKRSAIMRAVKSKGNKSTELKLILFFKKHGVHGWRRNYPLFGKPDFAFPKSRLAIFLDGCFWHGHSCRNTKPKQNTDYWSIKISKNKNRDNLVTDCLLKKGWNVLRIWECDLKSESKIYNLLHGRLNLKDTHSH